MLPILNRTQETLFFSRNTFTKFLFLFVMFCIYPIVAKHFEMFFRDVDNQFLDEVQSRNSFSNSFVVFVSGVHFIFNFTKRWTNAGSKLFKENFTEGITKEIVIKVFDRTPGSDVTSPTFGDESVDMRIPFYNGDEHKKQAYRTYEKNEAGC